MEVETEDPWEALDLDDSDLPSFLPPRKRKPQLSSPPNPEKSFAESPFLQPCSLLSGRATTQNPLSHPLSPHSESEHHIPGPAGAVQAAMFRKRQNPGNQAYIGEELVATQEYIRRAVEDPGGEDEDFSRDPWLVTVDFIRREGLADGDGGAIGTPLSSIKNGLPMYKVNQVVAIVKSCTPNGLGDLMVTLKDPTDTIDASIHRKVLVEGDYGKEISVGTVLILQKVAVFSPSPSVHYLNITVGNVVKVFSKDKGLPSRQTASTVKFAIHGFGNSKQPLVEQGRNDETSYNLRQAANARGGEQSDKGIEGDENLGSSCCSDGSYKNQISDAGKEPSLVRQDVVNIMDKVGLGHRTNTHDQVAIVGKQASAGNEASRDNQLDNIQSSVSAAKMVGINDKQENETIQGEKQGKPLMSRGALPHWTDEQLDELFAME
ncbi:hypothetical protein SLEP1_g33401 [Rubroshorea leprosula]|uniref:Homologous recombination OB-fold protein OB-fold domain-containing protein n=1 Tax=Rubroshorea leprosula TaxID=152421 RepID=A0AAV5KGP3_9ROSI|nr:hypothetical protein SLEP1_g33401 [Rubroshorea leprosula]